MTTNASGQANVRRVPLSELKPAPYNPRKISSEALTGLKASIRRFGLVQPIIVNRRTGYVVGGHQRIRALLEAGEDSALVLDVDLPESEEKALNLALNSHHIEGEWTEGLGDVLSEVKLELPELFVDLRLGDLLADVPKSKVEVVEDEVPEAPKVPVTKAGDLWTLGRHRLLCGDSTKAGDVGRLMGGESADCIFTSPPYAVGIDYGIYEDTIENLRAMLPVLASGWHDVLVDGGFVVVNFGDVLSGKVIAGSDTVCEYPMALEYWPVFRSAGWVLWSRRVWCKPCAAVGSSRHCISSNRAASNFEHIWTWKRPGTPPVTDQISGQFQSQAGWFDTTHDNKLGVGLKVHGAGMPVGVAARMIAVHSRDGSIVHEPFTGTGTTLIAAEQLDRRCFGLEIEPAYCDVIVERWQNLTGGKATR